MYIQSVTVDGQNKGKITSSHLEDIKEAHSISATFVKKTFKITACRYWRLHFPAVLPPSPTVIARPYHPQSGLSSPLSLTVNKGEMTSYTSNIKAAHSISVTFEPSGKVDIGRPDVGRRWQSMAALTATASRAATAFEVPVSYMMLLS